MNAHRNPEKNIKVRVPPKQTRARATEEKFLASFNELVAKNGYSHTTIGDIADHAGLTKSAFLKRFGSKDGALLVLYQRYCTDAIETMAKVRDFLPTIETALDAIKFASHRYEELLERHHSANRAMYEVFLKDLTVHPLTKEIFRECVSLMSQIQSHYMNDTPFTKEGAYAAAQLLVTLGYNQFLQAMPGLKMNNDTRHELNAEIIFASLRK